MWGMGGMQVHRIRARIGKWLRLYQTIKYLTSGDMGILLKVIRLGVTGLKMIRLVYFLDLFEGRGEKGKCDLV